MLIKQKVSVLMGGLSNERAVSLVSGENVTKALQSLGTYDVTSVTLDAADLSSLPPACEACFIALHGGWGENGGVQEALDRLSIPYTGPGAQACRLTMDKIETKKVLDRVGLPNAPWCVVQDEEATATSLPLPLPVVVKPPRDGSSVGMTCVREHAQWAQAVHMACRVDREKFGGPGVALVEAFIPGREMTVGIVGDHVLDVVEICAPHGWYGYEEKYHSTQTRYSFPTDAYLGEMQNLAKAAFAATHCRGIARVDFRVTNEGQMFILELNTSPGMTSHSLVPKAAAHAGLDFPHLCAQILSLARHD